MPVATDQWFVASGQWFVHRVIPDTVPVIPDIITPVIPTSRLPSFPTSLIGNPESGKDGGDFHVILSADANHVFHFDADGFAAHFLEKRDH